jgi:DNA helicase II / ATP-dependent DNA helicase PcrA
MEEVCPFSSNQHLTMSWNTNLTGPHLQIASSAAPRIRVMAGPGTGKSFAVKRRIARLIEVDGVDPERILAVTFTRTAARALERELQNMGVPGCENIAAGTVHAFCFGLLLRNDVFAFLERVPRGLITFNNKGVSGFEVKPLLADLQPLGHFGARREMTRRIRAFEADWARMQHQQPGWPIDPVDQQFHLALSEWLRFHRGMLIGELVPEALRYLRNNPASPALQRYDHIVVDEYQDLNRAEQELIDVVAAGKQLSIVGDVDQSIYRFRYAHPEGITDFGNRHQNVEDHALAECRRCRELIVTVSDNVIRGNYPPGANHRLVPLQPQPGPATVRVVQWPTLDAEADGIATFIRHLVTNRGFTAGDILVLSPRRLIANEIKRRLAVPGFRITAHSFYNDKLLEPEEAQVAITTLQLLSDPEDRVAMRYWLGHGSGSWRRGQYATLRNYCEQHNQSTASVLGQVAGGQIQLAGINQLTARFQELHVELARLTQLTVPDLFNDLFAPGSNWAEPIRELVTGKVDAVEDAGGLLDLLRTEITQPEMPAEGDFVRIMSLHKSKGLTSRVTIIVGCIHGLIPFIDADMDPADQPAHLQEQRRLFYVALTRAREVLVVSSVTSVPRALAYPIGAQIRGGNANNANTIACRFLHELGPQAPAALRGANWAAGGYA